MTTDPAPSADDDLTRFLVNRVGLLHRLLADRRSWRQARATLGPHRTPRVDWIDGDGQQQTVLTRDFLDGHDSVLHAVTDDLMQCGPDGQRLVQVILGNAPPPGSRPDDAPPGDRR